MNIHPYTISKLFLLGISSWTLGMVSYVLSRNELTRPLVNRIQIRLKDLPSSFSGFRIVQISDIHLKPIVKVNMVRKIVKIVNDLQPDMIVITGDFVTRFIDSIYQLGPELGNLHAPKGVFASLGNHDVWLDASVIIDTLNASSVKVLVNKGVSINVNGDKLWLAGIDDAMSGNPNLHEALKETPRNTPVVLLGHEPDIADEMSKDGRVGLMLTGHSHGGQIRIPRLNYSFKAPLAKKYDMGLYNVNGMWLYVNRGIGVITSVPIRLNCPPEITEFTLLP